MELGKEINEQEFNKWIVALRSGKYKQTKYKLQDENGFCCLGVACKEIINNPSVDINGKLAGKFPIQQSNSPLWLKTISADFYLIAGESPLTGLNDNQEYTFDEIADLLELVYVHKALD